MNIYEASKTGKRFKRPCWRNWFQEVAGYIQNSETKECGVFEFKSLISDDYIVEEVKKEFSWSEIQDVVLKASDPYLTSYAYLGKMKKLLGF